MKADITAESILRRVSLAVVALLVCLATVGYGQGIKPKKVSKKSRMALSQAEPGAVAMAAPVGHNDALDMYSPRPGGIEPSSVGKAKIVTDPNSKLAKKKTRHLAREERRINRRENRMKVHKDKQAMGRMVSLKNADPRRATKVHPR